MTQPPFATTDATVGKMFNWDAYYDTISDTTLIGQLSKRGVLDLRKDLEKGAGDTINYYLSNRIIGHGFTNNTTITGLENRPDLTSQSLKLFELNQVSKAEAKGTLSAQMTGFGDMADICNDNNRNWLQERMAVGVVNQLAGNTATSITWDGLSHSTAAQLLEVNAGSTPLAPSSGAATWANPSSNTTDQAVNADTTAKLTFGQILNLERIAASRRVYMPTLSTNGVKFLLLTHPDCFYDLINDVSSGHQARDMILSQMNSGNKKDFTVGDTFRYMSTEIMITDKIPRGVHSGTGAEQTNTRRSIFLGKNAGCLSFGKGFSLGSDTVPGFGTWQDTQDVGRINRFRTGVVFAAKKQTFASQDYSVLTLTNYVAQ